MKFNKEKEKRYYRVSERTENIFTHTSSELTEEGDGISIDDIFELYSTDNEDDLNDILDDHLFFSTDGDFGAGIYYNGVCCCSSLENLRFYFKNGSEGLTSDHVIFVFEGDWVGSCEDGDVVIPTTLIETLDISLLDK